MESLLWARCGAPCPSGIAESNGEAGLLSIFRETHMVVVQLVSVGL